jgi:hypothetical protein
MSPINLWLDDVRPAPAGWIHAKTAQEAIHLLKNYKIGRASLDHDLGDCQDCAKKKCPDIMKRDGVYKRGAKCECPCHMSGHTVTLFMAANNLWPQTKPAVHSANPVGARNMVNVINKYYPGDDNG